MGTPPREQTRLLIHDETLSAYDLAYQTLFTNIRLNWQSAPGRAHTLLLTTPTPSPAKAPALANLAIASAQNGIPTILVDADRDTSALQTYFGLNEQGGLSDLLLTEGAITPQKIAPSLQKTATPGLVVLGTGSKTRHVGDISRQFPFKLKSVIDALDQLLQGDESRSGLILFNSLPVLAGIDAALISALVEQTFLLIVTGQTTRTQAKKAYEQLERAHAKIAGLVMLNA